MHKERKEFQILPRSAQRRRKELKEFYSGPSFVNFELLFEYFVVKYNLPRRR